MANSQNTKTEFLKLFRTLGRHKHRYDVFRDFVTMSACMLHNAIAMDEKREAEYMAIILSYKKEEHQTFAKLFALLVDMLDGEPTDILGNLYMELEIASKDIGQFFTPPCVSGLMVKVTYGEELADLKLPFITLSEPACGAGGMVLSFVKEMISHGHNPAEKLWTQCIDIDRLSALMCYVQLSLWNVPAQVIVGDTLKWELREIWYSPAHHLGNWSYKLSKKSERSKADTTKQEEVPRAAELHETTSSQAIQFDFGF